MLNTKVDLYLAQGCMRCSLGATPDCKVHTWANELVELRRIVNQCQLTEDLKWKVPVYTFNNANVVLINAFKNYCCITFFKGVLLKDGEHILEKQGEHSETSRILKFTNVEQVLAVEEILKQYIAEAIEIEKSGKKVIIDKTLEYPEELITRFKELPEFKKAFESLTKGRQRAYIIEIAKAKQQKTRETRIDKFIPAIMAGKGLHDR